MGLRETLEAAVGDDPWYYPNYGEIRTKNADEIRLIALAPELAAGVLEAKDFAEEILCDEDIAEILMHDEGCERDDDPCPACALLARLDQIGVADETRLGKEQT